MWDLPLLIWWSYLFGIVKIEWTKTTLFCWVFSCALPRKKIPCTHHIAPRPIRPPTVVVHWAAARPDTPRNSGSWWKHRTSAKHPCSSTVAKRKFRLLKVSQKKKLGTFLCQENRHTFCIRYACAVLLTFFYLFLTEVTCVKFRKNWFNETRAAF